MLITKLKSKETIESLASGKVFIVNCHGCKEVSFPEQEAKELQKALAEIIRSKTQTASTRFPVVKWACESPLFHRSILCALRPVFRAVPRCDRRL